MCGYWPDKAKKHIAECEKHLPRLQCREMGILNSANDYELGALSLESINNRIKDILEKIAGNLSKNIFDILNSATL